MSTDTCESKRRGRGRSMANSRSQTGILVNKRIVIRNLAIKQLNKSRVKTGKTTRSKKNQTSLQFTAINGKIILEDSRKEAEFVSNQCHRKLQLLEVLSFNRSEYLQQRLIISCVQLLLTNKNYLKVLILCQITPKETELFPGRYVKFISVIISE